MATNKTVHVFCALDRYIALDSASGNIFQTDRLTASRLSVRTGDRLDTQSAFTPKEIIEADSAIDALIDEGVLFVEDTNAAPISQSVVKALCLNVCHDCNLRCEYCFADDGTYGGARSIMSQRTAFAAVDMLIRESKNRRNLEIDFFGGEPLLALDLVKATVEYATAQAARHGKDFRFTITTNGLLLTREVSDYLNSVMDNIVVSIDGRKEVHNYIRKTANGKDVFDKTVQNARYLAGIRGDRDYYIRGTYTAHNLDFASDVIALHQMGFDKLSVEPVVLPTGHRLAIKQEHLPQIRREYERLAQYFLQQQASGKPPVFFHFMLDFDNAPCLRKLVTACGAGCEYLAVSPDGGVYPCHQFVGTDYRIGTVDSELDRGIMSQMESCNIYAKPECASCWARYYCSGGCSANNFKLCGNVLSPHVLSCDIMRARLECAIALNICKNVDNLFD